jgi:hypothetical protein
MFDWQAGTKTKSLNSDGETGVLSRNFWMYWAVSVPLTIVVLLAWRTWWHRENIITNTNTHISSWIE